LRTRGTSLAPIRQDDIVTDALGQAGDAPPTDGERWTRVELARLGDSGWRPRAVLSFLRAAQIRANLTRSRRPALARQEGTWIFVGAAGWLVAARLLPSSPFARARGRGLMWWAGCAVMLDWHLGMIETPEGRVVGLGAADALTLTRAWLVPAVAHRAEPMLLLLGVLTDIADGRVARATRCTRFGRDLEGLVDACFSEAALRGALRAGGVSRLPAALERARLIGGTVWASTVYFAAGRVPDSAMRRSGRGAAPVRVAGLIAGGLGRRDLADRLLVTGTAIAAVGHLRGRHALHGRPWVVDERV
jgi:phosphatidylglycerophosphate synthase